MRIDQIEYLKAKCTGCMACVDVCPTHCVSPIIAADGFRYSTIDEAKCVNCGKCYSACPIEHKAETEYQQHLYAACALTAEERNRASSGGIFETLSNFCLERGYYVCGAAFDQLKLKHRVISTREELPPLLKSKYLQSDAVGVYRQIHDLLKRGEKVFFCGTPCQVSALKNLVGSPLSEGLLTADIICHGVPSQTTFDLYIESLSKKHHAEIEDFTFRVKDNKYKHAHGFSYRIRKNGKCKTVQGIYAKSSFYNAFKNYSIFRESCYSCKYATLARVSDITLADFWGIEKYGFEGKGENGVSMVITNTKKGQDVFASVQEGICSKEYPVSYGVESNYCLTNSTKKPKNRDAIIQALQTEDYDTVARKYMLSESLLGKTVHGVYWAMPAFVRNSLRKMRGRMQ